MQCTNAYTTAQTVTGLLQETTDAQCGHETKPTATQAYIQPSLPVRLISYLTQLCAHKLQNLK